MKARVTVTLKTGILDPQGKAIEGALRSLGVSGVASVRQGKVFDIEIEGFHTETGPGVYEAALKYDSLIRAADKAALVHDYLAQDTDEDFASALDMMGRLAHQDLLDFGRLAELLGYDRKLNTLDYPVSPRGYRILGRIPRLPKLVIQAIVREFSGLDEILAATDAELEAVDGVGDMRAKDIREGLRRLQEINLVDRYLQT